MLFFDDPAEVVSEFTYNYNVNQYNHALVKCKLDADKWDVAGLIRKWHPVIDSDIGTAVTKPLRERILAISLELQLVFNKTENLPKHSSNQQYALPLIRKFFPEVFNAIGTFEFRPLRYGGTLKLGNPIEDGNTLKLFEWELIHSVRNINFAGLLFHCHNEYISFYI